jgi:hypothetical protein
VLARVLEHLDLVNERVRAELHEHGYALLRGISSDEFATIAASLGEVLHHAVVVLDAFKRTYLASPEAVPFHTDHPEVATIGWWCEEQDAGDGASLLVDGLALLRSLDAADQADLARVALPCPTLFGTVPVDSHPVIDGLGRLFFAPWLARGAGAASARFASALRRAPTITVRLHSGDALFISNHRMLHGRRKLAVTSRRRLLRLWLAEPASSEPMIE